MFNRRTGFQGGPAGALGRLLAGGVARISWDSARRNEQFPARELGKYIIRSKFILLQKREFNVAQAGQTFTQIVRDVWNFCLKRDPEKASMAGDETKNLPDVSYAEVERKAALLATEHQAKSLPDIQGNNRKTAANCNTVK